MYETIKARYEKGYVTEEQLGRYVALGVLTEVEAAGIRGETPPVPEGTIDPEELGAAYKEGVNSYE